MNVRPMLKTRRRDATAAGGGYLAALAGYLLISLLLLAPLLPHFGSMIPGGPVAEVDGWQNVWNLWWVHRALTSGTNPFHTSYLHYPYGVDLYLQTLNFSNGIMVLPVTALFGEIAGYNVALLLALLLAGVGAYALALHVTGHRLASFVGGCVFAFAPFHLTKVWDGQLELIALQWLAFYVLFLLRTAELRRWRDALLGGICLALIGYTSWYYLLFFAVYSTLFVLLWLVTTPGWNTRWQMLTRVSLVALVGGVLLLPLLLPALRDVTAPTVATGSAVLDPNSENDLILIHSANLLDFWLPSYLHPLWGTAARELGQTWHPAIAGWNLTLGYGTLALALVGGIVAWRTAWRWWLLTLAALVLALGPVLQIGTVRTSIYLPYTLLLHLPGVSIARRPSHFVVIATLLFAPLVALGLRWLLTRGAPKYRALLALGLIALLAFEYAPPAWPLHRLTVHPYYVTLAGSQGALLDLPLRNESSGPLQAQMVHALPMIGGFVSRVPGNPFLNMTPELWELRGDRRRLLALRPEQKLQALSFYGIRHLVVHWELIEPRWRDDLAAALAELLPGITPVYTDAQITAYALPTVEVQPLAYLGLGWHAEEQEGERVWRWMQAAGDVVLVNPGETARIATVTIRAESYREPRVVTLTLDDEATLGEWTVAPSEAVYRLRLLLPPGEQRLGLSAAVTPEHGAAGGRALSIVVTEIAVTWDD